MKLLVIKIKTTACKSKQNEATVLVHFKTKNKTYHPRCPCLSFFSRKEMKVFDENIPAFFSIMDFNGLI